MSEWTCTIVYDFDKGSLIFANELIKKPSKNECRKIMGLLTPNFNEIILGIVVIGFAYSWCFPTRVCEADRQTNGCSVPLGIEAPFKRQFTPSCNKHDICYGCGHHFNWSRDECDRAFHQDMIFTCQSNHVIHRGRRSLVGEAILEIWYFFRGVSKEERRCKLMADMYYKGVRLFGKPHFERRDPQYCLNTCADRHGSPFEQVDFVGNS